ncbi:MAG: hypothetical protein R2708_25985 [Vicinamibacterales bacterium]
MSIMLRLTRGRLALGTATLAALMLGAASCGSPSQGETVSTAGQPDEPPPLKVIQHEEPRRDSVGPPPARFRWSAIEGADQYAIGLWNEADRLMWRKDDLTAPEVAWPEGLYVESGTYFWAVSALRQGRGDRQVRDGRLRGGAVNPATPDVCYTVFLLSRGGAVR